MAENAIDLHLHVYDRDRDRDGDDDHDHEQEEGEDALSLCDFPLDLDDNVDDKNPENELGKLWPAKTREAAAAPEFFEFFSDHSSEMCAADEIIFRGKLIPLELPPLPPPPSPQQKQPLLSIQPHKHRSFDEHRSRRNNRGGLGKRSESLSEFCTRTRSDRADNKTSLLRNSRSMDYHRHQRRCHDDVERDSSTGSAGKSNVSPKKGCFQSRWYGFMFGKDKFTPEMDLRDIKNRHSRRIQSLTSPTPEYGSNKFAGNRCSGKVFSWGFLRALSCMERTNVAVTASLCIPQA